MSGQRSINKIELILTLVILMIIAGTAIPSFIDQDPDSQLAAVEGVAGSLGSASAINYAVRSISADNGVPVQTCTDIVNALEGTLDSRYRVDASPIPEGDTVQCVVISDSGITATFVGHGIL